MQKCLVLRYTGNKRSGIRNFRKFAFYYCSTWLQGNTRGNISFIWIKMRFTVTIPTLKNRISLRFFLLDDALFPAQSLALAEAILSVGKRSASLHPEHFQQGLCLEIFRQRLGMNAVNQKISQSVRPLRRQRLAPDLLCSPGYHSFVILVYIV